MKELINKMVDGLLAVVPLERVVAAGLNLLLRRLDSSDNVNKLRKTITHIKESTALVERILDDGFVSAEEVTEAKTAAQNLRLQLLNIWVAGDSGKDTEAALASVDAE